MSQAAEILNIFEYYSELDEIKELHDILIKTFFKKFHVIGGVKSTSSDFFPVAAVISFNAMNIRYSNLFKLILNFF